MCFAGKHDNWIITHEAPLCRLPDLCIAWLGTKIPRLFMEYAPGHSWYSWYGEKPTFVPWYGSTFFWWILSPRASTFVNHDRTRVSLAHSTNLSLYSSRLQPPLLKWKQMEWSVRELRLGSFLFSLCISWLKLLRINFILGQDGFLLVTQNKN